MPNLVNFVYNSTIILLLLYDHVENCQCKTGIQEKDGKLVLI